MAVYKGWNAKIYQDGTEIGYCDSVSVDVATGLEPYYEIGSRQPKALVAGNEEITGSMSRAWIDTAMLALLSSGNMELTQFDLTFQAGSGGDAMYVYLYDCKFETGTVDIPQDGFLTQDFDFRALSIGFVPSA